MLTASRSTIGPRPPGRGTAEPGLRPAWRAGWLWLALAAVALGCVSACLLDHLLANRVLALEVERTAELLNGALAARAGTALPPAGAAAWQPVEPILASLADLPDVRLARLRAPDGDVLWRDAGADDEAAVDHRARLLARAAAGEPAATLATAPGPGEAVVASYIPLFEAGDPGRGVMGVLELHHARPPVLATLAAGGRWAAGSAGLAALLALGGIYGAARRADARVRRHAAATAGQHLDVAGGIAAAVARELHGPLGTIRACAELAGALRSPEHKAALLEEIMAHADEAAGRIKGHLHAARAEGAPRPAALGHVLAAVRASRAAELARRGIGWEQAEAPLPPVRVDPETLELALRSLVDHAITALPRGGAIAIGLGPAGGDAVELRVAAAGCARRPATPGLGAIGRILERQDVELALAGETGDPTLAILRLPTAR